MKKLFFKFLNKLGFAGVKLEVHTPAQIEKSSESFAGTVMVTTETYQDVKSVTVTLVKELTTTENDIEQTKTFELGTIEYKDGFSICSGEVRDIPFTLPFKPHMTGNDHLKKMGGVLGKIGEFNADKISHENAKYFVEAEAKVKGALVHPKKKCRIEMI